jgi:hypothetical protein
LVKVLLRWTAFTVVASFVAVWAVTDASVADLPAGGKLAPAGGKLVLAGHSLDPAEAGRVGLYVINGDGSGLRQITRSSTDGRRTGRPTAARSGSCGGSVASLTLSWCAVMVQGVA